MKNLLNDSKYKKEDKQLFSLNFLFAEKFNLTQKRVKKIFIQDLEVKSKSKFHDTNNLSNYRFYKPISKLLKR